MRKVRSGEGEAGSLTNTTYSSRYFTDEIPEHAIPKASMPARAAYQLISDELNLDGNPALNLASFVTTWMEPEAQALATETLNRNFVDQDEYPQTEEIHHRVVSMVGRLFNAPADGRAGRHRDDRVLGGDHARPARPQVELASAPWRRQRQAQTSSSAPTSTPAGRSSPATSTSSSG